MFSYLLTCPLLFLAFGQNDAAMRSPVLMWWEIPPEDTPIIYTEAAQMTFTDEDLSEKDNFKIHLREMIKYSLPNLPIDSVEKVADFLISSGVTQLSDMNLINETDLASVLKPIQARKLIHPFKKDQQRDKCPEGFFMSPTYKKSCISILPGKLTWEEATVLCNKFSKSKGQLAMIDTAAKSKAIEFVALYHNPTKCGWAWHSLVRYRNNFTSPWYYRTMNPDGAGYCERPAKYFNWLYGEPDFALNQEFCVQLRIGSWKPPYQDNDINCWVTACGLCEIFVQ